MSRGVNKVIILGNCCADPDVKYGESGSAVTNISVATSESWIDKTTKQKQERTEFHRVVFFKKLAEIAGEYLRKGSKVYIEGSLRTRKWQGQDGSDRYSTEVVADVMQMLDGKDSGDADRQSRTENSSPNPSAANQNRQTTQHQPAMDSFDDDIPFN